MTFLVFFHNKCVFSNLYGCAELLPQAPCSPSSSQGSTTGPRTLTDVRNLIIICSFSQNTLGLLTDSLCNFVITYSGSGKSGNGSQ